MFRYLAGISLSLALAGCTPEGGTPVTQSSRVPTVEPVKCEVPLGPLAVREPANRQVMELLTQIGIDSPVNALRVIAQRSGCFEVMDYQTIEQRLVAARATAGRSASGPVLGGVVFVLQPSISVNAPSITTPNNPTATQRSNVAPVAGDRTQNALSVLGPAVRSAAADVSLMAIELESGRQVAVAQGSHSDADFDVAAALLGPQARLLGTGYTQTAEGRTIVMALQKAFNGFVEDMRARGVSAGSLPATAMAAPVPARIAPPFRPNAEFIVAAGVNFREAPINGAVKRALVAGVRVKTTERREGIWWEIESDGETGWIASQFLRLP